MRRLLVLTAMGVMLPVGAAHAQTTPPTAPNAQTSTVQQPVATVASQTADTGDDDSDKTGLWGLLGLLGLAGLAGLKRRRDNDTTPPTIRNTAPPTSAGATSRTDRP